MSDFEDFNSGDWDDQFDDDIEIGGQKLAKLVQSNTPERLAGDRHIPGLNDGDYLLPNAGAWLVAYGGYAHIVIGASDLWVHWGANRSGFLGVSDTLPPKEPPGSRWLKPGVQPNANQPVVMKEGQYDLNDLSVYERTLYLHQIAYGIYDQSGAFLRLDPPILCSFPYKSTQHKTGQRFYCGGLKTTAAIVRGKAAHNMVLGAWRQGSEAAKKGAYGWKAPTQARLGVFGEPGYPAELARHAKRLRDEFKASPTPLWVPQPLPALAAPSASSPSAASLKPAPVSAPKADARSPRGAWAEPTSTPIPPNEGDSYGGPRDEDDIIFD
jgi:hypothetical protein